MAKIKLGSAGVTTREIDLSGPTKRTPQGVPAGVIGTSLKGPAFVPVTVGNVSEFYTKFGTTDGKKFGPLAATEWLRNALSLTYLRVLGVGDGLQKNPDGTVNAAGFTVGENLPNSTDWGNLVANPYAYANGPEGRTYFLGALMSGSADTDKEFLSGIQGDKTAIPFIKGVLMAPSGVVLTLSSSYSGISNTVSDTPSVSVGGAAAGAVKLFNVTNAGLSATSEFTLLLNGHKNTTTYPNVITASFDPKSGGNYFAVKLNTDPLLVQQAGHYLYASWNTHGFEVTGSGLLSSTYSANSSNGYRDLSAFILTGSLTRNSGSTTRPNYENFRTRFSHSKTPWIISQNLGGKYYNLFRLHSLDDGVGISNNYKFSIENISLSTDKENKYGTFDLLIRSWDDIDSNKVVLERYSGISLDPSSDRYISKVIGDVSTYYDFDRDEAAQKLTVVGNYPNISNIVRVEVSENVENETVDPTALPFGFRGVNHLVTSGSHPLSTMGDLPVVAAGKSFTQVLNSAKEPPLPFRLSIYEGDTTKRNVNSNLYWGAAFNEPILGSKNGTQLSKKVDAGVKTFAKFFPDFAEGALNFVVGDNDGVADTVENGILDADRYNSNLFTLGNIQVYTASNTGLADPQRWVDSKYSRGGAAVGSDSTGGYRALATSDLTTENKRFAKFSFFMQGGFNGTNLFDADESDINNYAVECDMENASRGQSNGPSVRSYIKALDVMKNVVNADIQLLAIPGIRNEFVTNTAAVNVEQRFDAFYIMDINNYDLNGGKVTGSLQQVSVEDTTRNFINRNMNTSFAAAYFPDVSMIDPSLNIAVDVPPSVVVLGALSLNDAVGHPWFAPAGFSRGALPTTLEPKVKLSKLNQDVLYDANVNPLVQFTTNPVAGMSPSGNVVVWGQKTLLASASALDRVNVRRLLIEIRRQVRDIAQTILFEPNRAATLAKFSAAVTPRLQRIQALAGLERFKVIIDSSTTTQQDVENNTIRGKVYVQPTKSIEFVSLDFVVANNIQQ